MAVSAAAEMQVLGQSSQLQAVMCLEHVAKALVHVDLGIVLPFHVIAS